MREIVQKQMICVAKLYAATETVTITLSVSRGYVENGDDGPNEMKDEHDDFFQRPISRREKACKKRNDAPKKSVLLLKKSAFLVGLKMDMIMLSSSAVVEDARCGRNEWDSGLARRGWGTSGQISLEKSSSEDWLDPTPGRGKSCLPLPCFGNARIGKLQITGWRLLAKRMANDSGSPGKMSALADCGVDDRWGRSEWVIDMSLPCSSSLISPKLWELLPPRNGMARVTPTIIHKGYHDNYYWTLQPFSQSQLDSHRTSPTPLYLACS
ncbi:2568_t:CDS:2 [Acaulospora colombiana]|uniref:2568_t:CDS:1 n=1 Tax=Acaulospora colombiana TaxID=27376 RepID=A0ACA9LAM5_9GLOM|nr:2568_t:CDS:2 [Acaulospora colombiana]